jgi:hypothetical protein
MYLNVFSMYLNVFVVYFIIFPMYLNVFMMCFQCIAMYLNVFIVYSKIFTNIVIGILPFHSHCNVSIIRIHIPIYFLLFIMTIFPTCPTTTFFSSILLFLLSYNL